MNEAHCGNDFNVQCTILTCENEIWEKHLKRYEFLKNPEMNKKNEYLSDK